VPRPASGKADRAALPEPPGQRGALGQDFVTPRRPAEQALAAIWADLLGLGRLSEQPDTTGTGELVNETSVSTEYVRSWLTDVIASYLEVPVDEVDTSLPLLDLGLDSLYRWEIAQEINRHFNIKLAKGSIGNTATTDTVAELIVKLVSNGTPAAGQP
jgi:acyl carrier protein